MNFATRMLAARRIVCAVLLMAMSAKAHAGVLADGFAIAGELYAASLLGPGRTAPRPATAEPAPAPAVSTKGGQCIERVARKDVPPGGREPPAGAAAPVPEPAGARPPAAAPAEPRVP
ncbi:MAG: hypothetical protein U1F58_08020 [Burkholderiales bacterium]